MKSSALVKNLSENNEAGMTLIEVLLYLAIFSIIFSGFMAFTFEFSRSIMHYSEREDDIRITTIVSEFVRWQMHHTEIWPIATTTTASGIAALFRFDPYLKPRDISLQQSGNNMEVSFTVNGRPQSILVYGLMPENQ